MAALPLYLENEARMLILARTLFSLAIREGDISSGINLKNLICVYSEDEKEGRDQGSKNLINFPSGDQRECFFLFFHIFYFLSL